MHKFAQPKDFLNHVKIVCSNTECNNTVILPISLANVLRDFVGLTVSRQTTKSCTIFTYKDIIHTRIYTFLDELNEVGC